jgi:hypothetical protein
MWAKAAGRESGSGTEVENMVEGGTVDGGKIAYTVSWFVSDSTSAFWTY